MSDLAKLDRIRQEMPATTARIFMNTGSFGPLPGCVIQAIQERFQDEWRNGRLGMATFQRMIATYSQAKSQVADLLQAGEKEIALTGNTGEGLNIISYGFNWNEGDEVITTNHEHPNALIPLYTIRQRFGIVPHMADLGPKAERPAAEAIAELVTPRTRLIVLSHITWTTGSVLDIAEVARLAHAYNIPVLIDGAQSAGAIPINVKELGVDFYALPMQKWLCGPDGTGALYVRQDAFKYISPTYVGFISVKHTDSSAGKQEAGKEWELADHAGRFEGGGRQTAAIAGQSAVLTWLEETVGFEWLFARIASLHTYAWNSLQTVAGLTMLTPKPGVSGIVSFALPGQETAPIVERLREKHNIFIRDIPLMKSLRVCTGFYNTEAEIDILVEALREITQQL